MITKEEALTHFIEFLRNRDVPEEVIETTIAFDGGFGPNTFGITCVGMVVYGGSAHDNLSTLNEHLEMFDQKYDIRELVTRQYIESALG